LAHLRWRAVTHAELDCRLVHKLIWVTALALVVCHGTVWAQGQPTLSGSWSATAMHVQWNIGEWGAACGPRPSGGGSGAGTVTVKQVGSELSISGLGREWSTTQCWEQYPGLARRSHSAGTRGWRNVCKTADSDPRQATVVTTLSATDTTMSFDETAEYQFVIQGQNCTASARRTRSFRLLQREGEPPRTEDVKPGEPSSAAGSEVSGPSRAAPKSSGRCAEKGAPARLEVSPARKLMRAGDSFQFRVSVVDQKGCTLAHKPDWSIIKGAEVVTLSGNGKVDVRPDAGEAEVTLSAQVRGESVNVVIEVVPRDRYEALLEQRGFNAEGESGEAARATIASGSIGAKSVVSQAGSDRRTTFVAVTGALALVVGVIGLFLIQRRRRQHGQPKPAEVLPTTGLSKRCPTCGREYSGDEQFCTEDASPLVLSSSAPPPPVAALPGLIHKICPVCGTQYPGVAEFCGNDGATLVPVN